MVLWVPEDYKANRVRLARRVNRDQKAIRETKVRPDRKAQQVMIIFLPRLINKKSLI